MKIKSIKPVGKKEVFDISVESAEHYVLRNGVVTHNTGSYYAANTVFMMGRSQEKDGTDLSGFKFTIGVDKSRFVKEKSKLPLHVDFEKGISKWSGLLDLAIESGHVVVPNQGWYSRATVDKTTGELVPETRKWRAKETDSAEFWIDLLKPDSGFPAWITSQYSLSAHSMEGLEGVEKLLLEDDEE